MINIFFLTNFYYFNFMLFIIGILSFIFHFKDKNIKIIKKIKEKMKKKRKKKKKKITKKRIKKKKKKKNRKKMN